MYVHINYIDKLLLGWVVKYCRLRIKLPSLEIDLDGKQKVAEMPFIRNRQKKLRPNKTC